MSRSNTVNDLLKPHSYETALTHHDGQDFLDVAGPFPDVETAQTAIDAWGHGYNHVRPHQSLGMAIPVSVFRPAPTEPIAASPAPTQPLTALEQDLTLPPAPLLPAPGVSPPEDVRAMGCETALTPRARLLLPDNQQFMFTAALARRPVTVWASERSIHVVLDGTVIRTLTSVRLRSA